METPVQDTMLLEVPALTQNVALCRVAVAAFASRLDFTVPEIEELKVATSEAVTNVVLHAYDGPGLVRVRAACRGACLEIEVQDWGKGIADISRARQASYTTMPGRMGLGFVFMESLTDHLEVSSEVSKGTTVRFLKCPSGDNSEADRLSGGARPEDAGA
ncbi:MAG: anti-sigma F factor [Bacillota bacterium]|nr:anti-sigma F factor [Bacillota bacterium]